MHSMLQEASYPPCRSGWVLHVVPPNGGGVDRWVRDVVARRAGDALLHVASAQWVLEARDLGFLPLSVRQKDERLAALGRPSWLHVHALTKPAMAAAGRLSRVLDCPIGVTLHDVLFAQPDPGAQARARFLQRARWILAPSKFLATLARDWLIRMNAAYRAPAVQVLPNGWQPWHAAPSTAATTAGPFGVAMVGAMGRHKGLDFAKAMVACLPPEIRVVLVGYADGQLTPGWLMSDRLWVHGVYEPEALPSILRAYHARVVWFAPGQPESFCYALSDVWQAGWPAVVPDCGALGERMRRRGFGWVYDPNSPPKRVANLLVDCLRRPPDVLPEQAGMAGEPTVGEMIRRLEMIYDSEDMSESSPPDWVALQRLAQTHLDSRFFRKELLRLQGNLEEAQAQISRLRAELNATAQAYEARGQWIEKLQSDIDALNASIAALQKLEAKKHWWETVSRWLDHIRGR